MKETSPSVTTTSNNRGGRPKDWTEERTRKLVRLYVYTKLPLIKIVRVLGDQNWKPGKDAANKWLNTLLGHDPRWIKPKTDEEEEKRMAGLKVTCHRSKSRNPQPSTAEDPGQSYGTAGESNTATPQDLEKLDDLTLDYSRASSLVESDGSTLANPTWVPAEANLPSTYEPLFDMSAESSQPPRTSFFPMSHLFQRNFRGQDTKRRDTTLTNSTGPSVTSSFRARMSGATTSQIKAAFQLIKRYTIPKESDGETSPSSPSLPTGLYSRGRSGSNGSRLIVSGDFLDVGPMWQTQDVSIFPPDGPDEPDETWDRVVKEVLSAQNLWPSKGHCCINSVNSWELPNLNPTTTDDFGNTIFHFLAARSSQRTLVDQIMQAQGGHLQTAIGYRNTAGQTFLHMLNRSWFEEGSSLDELLSMLQHLQFDILAADVYGRNFFHLLQENRLNHDRIRDLAHSFNIRTLNRRDAFDRKPMDSRSARRMWRAAAIHRLYPGRRPRLNLSIEDPVSARIRPNTELLRIVTNTVHVDAQSNPDSEDSEGRNGLQCLAEVVLGNSPIQQHAQPPSMKRKLGNDMEPKLQDGPLSFRLELLEGLIVAKVDVNHYDKSGQTPLMAFVKHIPDGTKEDKELRHIIRRLVDAGANMEARNRQGETVLYMAARLGKKVALSQLLELGANVYVRNAHGLHILDATHQALRTAANDPQLYARLHSCSAILTGKLGERWRTVTALDEWGVVRS